MPENKCFNDREVKVVVNHCDLCDDILPEALDNIESRILIQREIDDSFESEAR